MLEHTTTAVVTVVRFLTLVEVVDGSDRGSRVVVAHPITILRAEVDLVPMVVINVASRVTVGRSVLSIPIRDHFYYHLGVLIAKTGLLHFKVHRDKPFPQVWFHHPSSDPAAVPAPVSSLTI